MLCSLFHLCIELRGNIRTEKFSTSSVYFYHYTSEYCVSITLLFGLLSGLQFKFCILKLYSKMLNIDSMYSCVSYFEESDSSKKFQKKCISWVTTVKEAETWIVLWSLSAVVSVLLSIKNWIDTGN